MLVWDGTGWGAAWFGRFRTLDADGRPASPTATLPTGWAAAIGLDFAVGRYALVTSASAPARLGAFDRAGTFATGWGTGFSADALDVARLATAHQWLVGGVDRSTVTVHGVDDSMEPASVPISIAADGMGDVRVAGAKSRAMVVWNTGTTVLGQVLIAPPLATEGPPLHIMTVATNPDSGLEVEVFRDLVAIAAMDGRHVHLALVDMWLREVVAGPRTVGSSGITDRRPGIAVSPEHGFFVVCWATGRGPAGGSGSSDGIALQVVGTDGMPWGAPVELVGAEPNVGGVDCGWNGRDIVVLWWRASGDGAYNTMFSQRARPTFL